MKTKNTLLTLLTLWISGTIFAEKKVYLLNNSEALINYSSKVELPSGGTYHGGSSIAPKATKLLNYENSLPTFLRHGEFKLPANFPIGRDIIVKGLGGLNNSLQQALTLLKNNANRDAAVVIIINPDFSLAIQKAPAPSTSTTSSLPPSRPLPAIPK